MMLFLQVWQDVAAMPTPARHQLRYLVASIVNLTLRFRHPLDITFFDTDVEYHYLLSIECGFGIDVAG
jgi:hypothetical protein